MAESTHFDLERALATWRHLLSQRRTFSTEVLDELERHLRDHVAHSVARGVAVERAFEKAIDGLGDLEGGEREYKKVYWGKLRRQNRWLEEVQWWFIMLRNYLSITVRGIRRKPIYTIINMLGFALGLGLCLTIALYIQHELRYDRFLPKSERVYRIIRQPAPEQPYNVYMPSGLGATLQGQVPAVEHLTELEEPERTIFMMGDKHIFLDGVIKADSHFLSVFPYAMKKGNPETALAGPGKLVLTASAAKKMFGDEEPLGQVVQYKGSEEGAFVVTGVINDPPSHTHLRFDAVRSRVNSTEDEREGGIQWNYYARAVYFTLLPDASPEDAKAQIVAVERATNNQSWMQEQVVDIEFVPDVYLRSKVSLDLAAKSSVRYLYLFGVIGALLLLIACINYINLATAQAMTRVKEVGVRKTLGAGGFQLFNQFIAESLLIALLAVPLAIGFTLLALPIINGLLDVDISLRALVDGKLLAGFLLVTLFSGILAGSYPALFLARHQAFNIFRGGTGRAGGSGIRKGLVVFQFVVSLVLIMCTLIVNAQLKYIQNKDLGFDGRYVIQAPSKGLDTNYEAFKAALMQKNTIAAVSSGMPLGVGLSTLSMNLPTDEEGELWGLNLVRADYDYFKVLNLPIIQGQSFDHEFNGDGRVMVVINETAVHNLKLSGDPVGQQVSSFMRTLPTEEHPDGETQMATIVGVVEDFHNKSLHEQKTAGFMFHLKPGRKNNLLIRLKAEDVKQGLADVQAVWSEFVPDRPLDYKFLDDSIAAQYQKETRLGRVFIVFAVLTIFVACLGLFGLAAFAATRRTKEIGIRKALGATVTNIIVMLSRDFVFLVGFAFIFAMPAAYFSMQNWLERFAYRAEVGASTFILAGLLALLMTLISVSSQAVVAASRNPVESLRHE